MQLYLLFSRIIALDSFTSSLRFCFTWNSKSGNQRFTINPAFHHLDSSIVQALLPSSYSQIQFQVGSVIVFLPFLSCFYDLFFEKLARVCQIASEFFQQVTPGVRLASKEKKIKSFYLLFYYRESQRWHEFRWFVMKENRFSSKQRNEELFVLLFLVIPNFRLEHNNS
jgi:hypothetical protein